MDSRAKARLPVPQPARYAHTLYPVRTCGHVRVLPLRTSNKAPARPWCVRKSQRMQWVTTRRTQCEQISSGLPYKRTSRDRFVTSQKGPTEICDVIKRVKRNACP